MSFSVIDGLVFYFYQNKCMLEDCRLNAHLLSSVIGCRQIYDVRLTFPGGKHRRVLTSTKPYGLVCVG